MIELLVALAILALVITTSLAIFFDRQKRLLLASDNIQAYQAIANEAEIQKRKHYGALVVNSTEPFETLHDLSGEPTIVDSLKDPDDKVTITQVGDGVRAITMTVTWGEAKSRHHAQLTILKTEARLW